jgi:hypothetical protein
VRVLIATIAVVLMASLLDWSALLDRLGAAAWQYKQSHTHTQPVTKKDRRVAVDLHLQ